MRIVVLLAAASAAGCSIGATTPPEHPKLVREQAELARGSSTPSLARDEAAIEAEVDLSRIERLARARSPVILEARARARAALARVEATGGLPDPEFKYELWGHPLSRPWDLGMTQMHMFGLRQTFPAAGSLDARRRAAFEEARLAVENARTRELDLLAEIRKAWLVYVTSEREKEIHLAHGVVTERLVALATAQAQIGRGSQADLLRLIVERARVHGELIVLDERRETSRARMNALLGRPPEAKLGKAPAPGASPPPLPLEELRALARKRPELAAAASAVRREEAALDVAKKEATWPSLMLGIDYQLMPSMPMPHNVGAMVQVGLPWLNPRHGHEIRAAEASVSAERDAVAALEATILSELREALARYQAARSTYVLIDETLAPQTRKLLEASQATWAAGGGESLAVVDALRADLQVQLERSRALAQVEVARIDVERAIGAPIPPPADRGPPAPREEAEHGTRAP
jgi:outer membrane protein TolC